MSKSGQPQYQKSEKGKATARRWRESSKGKAWSQNYLERYRDFLRPLKQKPCADCGGTFDPVCMDFDHRPGEAKLFGIARRWSQKSFEDIEAEIAKCDLVCANCHRLRTHRQRNHGASSAEGKKRVREAKAKQPVVAFEMPDDHEMEIVR